MVELKINGKQNFMGFDIPVIEGGFGEGQKVMLAKTIAELHDLKLFKINELINNNIEEFEIGVDLLDLKGNENFAILCKDNGIISQNALNSSKNIYLLSEQGYMLLVGFMRTEKAKEIRKQLRREYFTMREIINSEEQLIAQLTYSIYKGGQEGILASKQLTDIEVSKATKPLLTKIEEDKPLVTFAERVTNSSDCIDVGQFAKVIRDEGLNIGRNKLFEKLRELKYLMGNNCPYQKHIDSGLFKVVETLKTTPYGEKTFTKTLITGKGQVKLLEKLMESENKNNGLIK